MFCPKCGNETEPDDIICPECGCELTPRGAVCPECGAELVSGAGFCHQCGHRVGTRVEPKSEHAAPVDVAPMLDEAYSPAAEANPPATLEEYCEANPGWLQKKIDGVLSFYRTRGFFGDDWINDCILEASYKASGNVLKESLTINFANGSISANFKNLGATLLLKRALKKTAKEHRDICYSYFTPVDLEQETGISGIGVLMMLFDEAGHNFFSASWNRNGLVLAT